MLKDKALHKTILSIAIPISLQMLLSYGVQAIDGIMLGQLGETEMTSANLGNQMFWMFSMISNGIAAGAAVLIAQYYGKNQIKPIKTIMAMAWKTIAVISVLYSLSVVLFPENYMDIFTNDAGVILNGASYLSIIALSYPLYAISFCYLSYCRALGQAHIILTVNGISYTVNMALNYILIFGKFGFPEMGVAGAALGTLIARIVEFVFVLLHMHKYERVAKFRLPDLKLFDKQLFKDWFKYTLPLVGCDISMGFSVTVQASILGNVSTFATAANGIALIVCQIASTLFSGVSNAATVIIGRHTGRGEKDYVQKLSKFFIGLTLSLGVVAFIFNFAASFFVPDLYNIEETTKIMVSQLMIVYAFDAIFYSLEFITIVGILRGGGAAKFTFWAVFIPNWCYGVPLAALAAFVFNWSPVAIVAIARSAIAFMGIASVIKIRRGNWIENVTRD